MIARHVTLMPGIRLWMVATFDALPKEDGMISKHQNKFGKFAKIAGAVVACFVDGHLDRNHRDCHEVIQQI